jgi:molybdopterin/thiamine biosynthesis adenylyltransferase
VFSHIFVQDWLFKNVTSSLIEEIQKHISKPRKSEYVVFSTDQTDGNLACFGLEMRRPSHADKHPLFDARSCKSITPLLVKRVDASFLVARGNVFNSLFDKRGVIIGCGSVGGFIGEDLIRMGVSSLTLIDHDILSRENIHRHCIGWRGIGSYKVDALRMHFSNAFPNVQIKAFPNTAHDVIQNQKVDFSLVDFVVIATGNPATNCFLTQYFRDKHPGLPVLFSWLDPYGLGGHCLITNLKNSRGCYFCLYGDDVHFGSNRASFAHMNQPKPFSKFISGCNSAFVPYGSLDARQVANLTIRNLEKVLAGKETINAIVSWKGDSEAFEQAGFRVSNRYKQSELELMNLRHDFTDENCPICGDNF